LSTWVFDIWKFPGEAAPAAQATESAEPIVEADVEALDQLPEIPT
jgi:hypothetical protein